MNALVGHAGKSTRSRHYAGADTLFTQMKAAVDALPPIDWDGPLDRGSKISLAKRRQSERRTLPQSTG